LTPFTEFSVTHFPLKIQKLLWLRYTSLEVDKDEVKATPHKRSVNSTSSRGLSPSKLGKFVQDCLLMKSILKVC
jgi:hypothetical protein